MRNCVVGRETGDIFGGMCHKRKINAISSCTLE